MGDKKITTVYQSDDYSKFKLIDGNRPIDHAKKIIESIKEIGMLWQPILVNERFEIIDGQGRFLAMKTLKLPIIYIRQDGLTIKEVRYLNKNATNWKVGDKVVVKSWKTLKDKYGLDSLGIIKDIAFVGGMEKYCGEVGIVNEVCGNYVHLDIYGSDTGYGFHKDSIEPWDSTIREGDIVKIIDSGCIYTTNIPWLKANIDDTDLIARYQYGTSPEHNGGKYKVIKIAKHLMLDDELAYIQSIGFEGKCYIIGVTGLDKTDEP